MFQVGDLICYGNSGVCKVAEVGPRDTRGADPDKLYYTLQPLYSSETIYIPVNTGVFMRPALSRDEAECLIDRIPAIRGDICNDRSLTTLRSHYESCLQTHACEDLVQLIKGVWSKSRDAERSGKKPGQVDQRYKKRAEDLLHGELAAALGMERDEVAAYIDRRVKGRDGGSALSPELGA